MSEHELSVVVPHYATPQLLGECLQQMKMLGHDISLEVIVVDNASISDRASWIQRFPWVHWDFLDENRGFAAPVNRGVHAARGRELLILNPDARIDGGSLEALRRALRSSDDIGAVSPVLVAPSGEQQPSSGRTPTLARLLAGKLGRMLDGAGRRVPVPEAPAEVDWLSATVLLCRRAAWEAVGGMDEGFFMYYEDCDLGLRLRQRGWRSLLVPSARAVHIGGASFAGNRAWQLAAFHASEDRYFRKHRPPVELAALRLLRPVYEALRLRTALYGSPKKGGGPLSRSR